MSGRQHLVAHPMEKQGEVLLSAPRLDELVTVVVERWSTDVLDVEAWCVVEVGRERHRKWHCTPGRAADDALRHFTIVGHGDPPCAARTLIRRPLVPRGFRIADEVRER